MAICWQDLYSERVRARGDSTLTNLMSFSSSQDFISLAGGFPAPELFPVEEFRRAMERVMLSEGQDALQYGPTEGYLPLREFLAYEMARGGIRADAHEVLITTGSQQGLDLVARLFLDPGSVVVVEDPTYLGGLDAFGACQADYLVVPMDEHGMQVNALEGQLAQSDPKPRLIYALPNFQNPTGGTMDLERRRHLLELSYRYSIPILEDDPYGELRYEGEDLPSLKSLDDQGNVIYLGTFSKTISPGIRLGWTVAPQEVIRQLVKLKQATDLATDSLAQRVAYQVCQNGQLERLTARLRPVYRERRDAMLRALERYFPEGSSWTRPQGGLFLWVTLPEQLDAAAMLADAVRERVAYVPGVAFHPRGDRNNTMRLNFSNANPAQIEEGIRRLGMVIGRALGSAKPKTPLRSRAA